MQSYQPSRLQLLALNKMAATISAAMHKKAPELFGGAPKACADVEATYLPKLVDMSDPFPQSCWFGAKVKATKIFNHKGKALTVDYIEEYPPDTNAAALWLSNRQRGKWRASNAGADAQSGFDLAGFVGALSSGIARGIAQQAGPGAAAKPIDPLDVVLDEPEQG